VSQQTFRDDEMRLHDYFGMAMRLGDRTGIDSANGEIASCVVRR
jgi:hypothetical protein